MEGEIVVGDKRKGCLKGTSTLDADVPSGLFRSGMYAKHGRKYGGRCGENLNLTSYKTDPILLSLNHSLIFHFFPSLVHLLIDLALK